MLKNLEIFEVTYQYFSVKTCRILVKQTISINFKTQNISTTKIDKKSLTIG